jgi:opacity protein-like surface antigen
VAKAGPYVFGTLGAVHNSVRYESPLPGHDVDPVKSKFGGQLGLGMQFTDQVGAELFVQASKPQTFLADNGYAHHYENRVLGARVTLGSSAAEPWRLFAKLGVARVQNRNSESPATDWTQLPGQPRYSNSQTRPTAGIGIAFKLTEQLLLRADFDHYFPRGQNNPRWGRLDYFGVGLQYNF